ncbi:hypothetical protein ACA910_006780 [Epithemia clementina (nom. ined.)]
MEKIIPFIALLLACLVSHHGVVDAMSLMQADQDRTSVQLRQQQIQRNQEQEMYGNRRAYEIPGLPRNGRYNNNNNYNNRSNRRYDYNYNAKRFRRRDPSLGWLPTIADWVQPKVESLARKNYVPPYRYNVATGRYTNSNNSYDRQMGGAGGGNNNWLTSSSTTASSAAQRRLGWMRDEEQLPQQELPRQQVEPFRRRVATNTASNRRQEQAYGGGGGGNSNYYDDYARSYNDDDNYFANRENYYDDSGRGRTLNGYEDPPYLSGSGTTSMDRSQILRSQQGQQPPTTVVRRRSSTSPQKSSYSSDFADGGSLRKNDYYPPPVNRNGVSPRMGSYSTENNYENNSNLINSSARARARSLAGTTEIPSDGSVVTFPMLDPSVTSVKVALEAPSTVGGMSYLAGAAGAPLIEAVVEIWQEMLNGASSQIDEVFVTDEYGRGVCEAVIDLPSPTSYDATFSIAIRNVGPPEYPIYARVTPYSGRVSRQSDNYGPDNLTNQNRRLNNRSRNRYFRGSGRRLYNSENSNLGTSSPKGANDYDRRRVGGGGYNDNYGGDYGDYGNDYYDDYDRNSYGRPSSPPPPQYNGNYARGGGTGVPPPPAAYNNGPSDYGRYADRPLPPGPPGGVGPDPYY